MKTLACIAVFMFLAKRFYGPFVAFLNRISPAEPKTVYNPRPKGQVAPIR